MAGSSQISTIWHITSAKVVNNVTDIVTAADRVTDIYNIRGGALFNAAYGTINLTRPAFHTRGVQKLGGGRGNVTQKGTQMPLLYDIWTSCNKREVMRHVGIAISTSFGEVSNCKLHTASPSAHHFGEYTGGMSAAASFGGIITWNAVIVTISG